jgi:hypothetical protein
MQTSTEARELVSTNPPSRQDRVCGRWRFRLRTLLLLPVLCAAIICRFPSPLQRQSPHLQEAYRQFQIELRVMASETDSPVPGARVVVEDPYDQCWSKHPILDQSTDTDQQGIARIRRDFFVYRNRSSLGESYSIGSRLRIRVTAGGYRPIVIDPDNSYSGKSYREKDLPLKIVLEDIFIEPSDR